MTNAFIPPAQRCRKARTRICRSGSWASGPDFAWVEAHLIRLFTVGLQLEFPSKGWRPRGVVVGASPVR
ncbi:hypothetical protein [Lysobacter gummosus]|uniref:hypothetical protein n=1 Tax=Lysobacter gummosus TaxID=262324 RepID=UPI003640FF7D